MGLDMYLTKFPRIGDCTVKEICAVEELMEYNKFMETAKEKDKCSFKEWSKYSFENLPDEERINQVKNQVKLSYYEWDTEKKHPHYFCSKEVGYWRKANQIHNWFVENVQNGEDDCDYHREITISDFQSLRRLCKKVLNSLNLKDGTIENGYTYENGIKTPILEEGKVATNTELADELLPTCEGCFFGGTNYDEYYAEDLERTIEIIDKVLEETDFNTEMIYYCSSW